MFAFRELSLENSRNYLENGDRELPEEDSPEREPPVAEERTNPNVAPNAAFGRARRLFRKSVRSLRMHQILLSNAYRLFLKSASCQMMRKLFVRSRITFFRGGY